MDGATHGEGRLRRVERVAAGRDSTVEVGALAVLARRVAGRDHLLAAILVVVAVLEVVVAGVDAHGCRRAGGVVQEWEAGLG